MTLSIIIPVYNEVHYISNLINRVIKYTPKTKTKIIIVDDCSNDGTKEWLINNKNIKTKKHIKTKLILKQKNEGKGSAIIEGLKYTNINDIILIQDADLEYDPKDISKLWKKIKEGNDVVFGNRFHTIRHYHYKTFAIANYFISKVISLLFFYKISDAAVCYKMFKRRKIDKRITLKEKGFMFDFEFVSKILKKKQNLKISEVDISYKGRTFEEGKKISWIDGFRALLIILKVKLFY